MQLRVYEERFGAGAAAALRSRLAAEWAQLRAIRQAALRGRGSRKVGFCGFRL